VSAEPLIKSKTVKQMENWSLGHIIIYLRKKKNKEQRTQKKKKKKCS
jgi:hypothetical protein